MPVSCISFTVLYRLSFIQMHRAFKLSGEIGLENIDFIRPTKWNKSSSLNCSVSLPNDNLIVRNEFLFVPLFSLRFHYRRIVCIMLSIGTRTISLSIERISVSSVRECTLVWHNSLKFIWLFDVHFSRAWHTRKFYLSIVVQQISTKSRSPGNCTLEPLLTQRSGINTL